MKSGLHLSFALFKQPNLHPENGAMNFRFAKKSLVRLLAGL